MVTFPLSVLPASLLNYRCTKSSCKGSGTGERLVKELKKFQKLPVPGSDILLACENWVSLSETLCLFELLHFQHCEKQITELQSKVLHIDLFKGNIFLSPK